MDSKENRMWLFGPGGIAQSDPLGLALLVLAAQGQPRLHPRGATPKAVRCARSRLKKQGFFENGKVTRAGWELLGGILVGRSKGRSEGRLDRQESIAVQEFPGKEVQSRGWSEGRFQGQADPASRARNNIYKNNNKMKKTGPARPGFSDPGPVGPAQGRAEKAGLEVENFENQKVRLLTKAVHAALDRVFPNLSEEQLRGKVRELLNEVPQEDILLAARHLAATPPLDVRKPLQLLGLRATRPSWLARARDWVSQEAASTETPGAENEAFGPPRPLVDEAVLVAQALADRAKDVARWAAGEGV